MHAVERMDESEVAPVCARKRKALPGGVGAAFSREWLVEAIGAHPASRSGTRRWSRDALGGWRIASATAATRADWQRVRRLLVVDREADGERGGR